ncbi:related to VPS36 protein, involved in vacuolar protein sorting [Cephalotrichum gorgonifer]|uniref:Vacuolar protein-sorting-associated protein 36 n=1 Tax=Cephalotrichum gorgonifer TaxID=2041049 RepID=A0AAE8MU20_9PEZI|nr:related to VPS36 protein, involved in vacuolar protein sorting [Cephalotrichum gorgonifer]
MLAYMRGRVVPFPRPRDLKSGGATTATASNLAEPRKHSVALDLKAVDRYEFYAGFLTSSAKITLVPKPPKRPIATPSRASSPRVHQPQLPPATAATWVCAICSFSNPVPSNFDPAAATAHTPLPPCLACGIKPTLTHVLKAAISSANNRTAAVPPVANPSMPLPFRTQASSPRPSDASSSQDSPGLAPSTPTADAGASFQCPRCTFSNHPSLLSCEMCGASLISRDAPAPVAKEPSRTESPGPISTSGPSKVDTLDVVKISFRGGGEKIFHERLKGAMTQKKWLLHGAPPIPKSSRGGDEFGSPGTPGSDGENRTQRRAAGIAALEQRGLDMRKNNELMIGDAFEDLESLMAAGKEIVALAEQFARQGSGLGGSAALEASALVNQLGLVTTKDIVGGGSSSETLYLSELARNLAEFLTDDARGVLKKAGGVINLVDLWATFNRARGGVELVSPRDFERAAMMWEKLKLPVRLRKFKSGVMVVQSHDRTDETTIAALVAWLNDLHEFPPDKEVAWDWHQFGVGVTAQDAAQRFGWSIGVAEEELEMAEEKGVVCREEGIEGLKFWKNYIDTGDIKLPEPREEEHKKIVKALRENGIL